MRPICGKALKNGRRLLAGMLVLLLLLPFSACRKGEVGEDVSTGGQDAAQKSEWVYVPKTLDIDCSSFYLMKQVGDYLYCPVYEWDEETFRSSYGMCRYKIPDCSKERLPFLLEGDLNKFDIGADDSLYAAVYHWEQDAENGAGGGHALEKYDAAGQKIYSVDISKFTGFDIDMTTAGSYLVNLNADSEGRVYLVCGNGVHLFDKEGNYAGSVDPCEGSPDSRINRSGIGKDGKMYVTVNDASYQFDLIEVDFGKKTATVIAEKFPCSNNGNINVSFEKDFLVHDATAVYEYDLAQKSAETLFTWSDCGISGSGAVSVGYLSDGSVLALLNNWETNESSAMVFRKMSAEQANERETIVLAVVYKTTIVEQMVADFNKKSNEYRVVVKEYANGTEGNEGFQRLEMDLLSDENCPDLVSVSYLQPENLVKQGLLEDLAPYLEKSRVISREDFMDNVLEYSTYDGVLACIPKLFSLMTIVGHASDVGPDMGWTLEGFMELAESRPDIQLFQYADNKMGLMDICLRYDQDHFMDWEAGQCNFNTPEFIRLMEFADRRGSDPQPESDLSYATRIQNGEVLLSEANLWEFNCIQLYGEIFKGDACFVGYPTADGTPTSSLVMNEACGIAARSKHKEGAWEFLESYVTAENTRYMYAFPALKKRLQEQMDEAMKIEYALDENGEPLLDENGEPILSGENTYMGSYPDGWEYLYRPCTQEEAEVILETIRTAKRQSQPNMAIKAIVYEEIGAYFDGSKSAEEVADIIQNRAQLCMDEDR